MSPQFINDQFNIVRLHKWREDDRERYLSGRGRYEVAGVIETFSDFLPALQRRDELIRLTESLMMLGVSFSAQYNIEIQQVRKVNGITRTRIVDLTERDTTTGKALNDVFFGTSTEDLVRQTLELGLTRETDD